jgi:hypothetical protein
MQEENDDILEQVTSSEYKYGFVTNIEADDGRHYKVHFCEEK